MKGSRSRFSGEIARYFVITLAAMLVLVNGISCTSRHEQQPTASATPQATNAPTQQPTDTAALQPTDAAAQPAPKIPPEQLDSLVAPIALYPDPLLSQTLVASTYPLEIIQLQQWLEKNNGLKDQALVDAVSKQPWDPSVLAMAALPDVVKRLADDVQWTTDLGNAFLAQQSDVMDAVQRMRQKAQGTGALKSNQQLKVETKVVESKTVIVVEQASPEVVYVPTYDPVYVYGPAVYPYPPIYYPPYPTGTVIAASAISFGVGVAIGAAWGGGWGWGCGWGGNDIDVNVNNNFNRNTNISGGNRVNNISGGANKWQHNPRHRGGAPYGDRQTANRFGGPARGDSLANRQSNARQQIGRESGNLPSSRDRAGQAGDRAGGRGGDRAAGTNVGDRAGSRGGDRAGGAGVGDRGGSRGGDRAGASNRARTGGGDRVGNREVQRSSGGRDTSAFGGGGSGSFNGGNARSSSSRGASSFGGSRGGSPGGGSRGGGGFSGGGGGSRGGGGGGSRGGGGGRR